MVNHLSFRCFALAACLALAFSVAGDNKADLSVADMAFVDELHGWVLVSDPTPAILRTTDGGVTWKKTPIPEHTAFGRIRFFDKNTGIAISYETGNRMGIYRTENGGVTWARVNQITPPYGAHVVDLALLSPVEAYLVGEGEFGRGYVARLTEGGRRLETPSGLPVDFSGQSNALTVFGDGAGHLWIAGKEFVIHSADGGQTWENQYGNSSRHFDMAMAGTALPGGYAWLAVANWEIYRTEDYGKHWIRALSTENEGDINFQSIAFSDPRHGCAVGDTSFVYCTDDGGVRWSRRKALQEFPVGSPFVSKIYLFGSRAWANVAGALYESNDGGKSFQEVLTSSTPQKTNIPGEYAALGMSINGPTQLTYDEHGFLYIVESMQGRLLRLDLKRRSLSVVIPQPDDGLNGHFDYPQAIASDHRGHIYMADFNGRLRRLDVVSGWVETILPSPERTSDPPLEVPESMTVDRAGNPLIVDRHHKLYRWRVDRAELQTVAGTGAGGFSGDGALAAAARLWFPSGVAIDLAGNIYVADHENCRIRKIDGESLVITTIAGTGQCKSTGDGGPAKHASVNYPTSIAADRFGNIYFIDAGEVRRIGSGGLISTYVASKRKGRPDGLLGANDASGLAVDPEGNLYVAEYVRNQIVRVDALSHQVTAIAGNGKPQRIDIVM